MSTVILGIESSCDDTSASICVDGKILANVIAGQEVHKEWGGVVPELASRAHQQNLIPTVSAALKQAAVNVEDISAVAFTRGPGLIGSLLVGTSFAKSFAMAGDIPIIEVNHMQAHVLAHFIEKPTPSFPFICLTVSGGHTQIVLVRDYLEMEVIGTTRDDAAGEAFDKSAKILGLPYPGGPLIDEKAQEGDPKAFRFAEPDMPGLEFSFSGVKTSILYFLRDKQAEDPQFIEENLPDLCASIQHTIVNILMHKLEKAAQEHKVSEIAIAGGVSANSGLRKALLEKGRALGWKTYIPAFEYCTDNAGMIAITGYYKFLEGKFADLDIQPAARLPF
jgi:N6-L-threonylcarbamoyladenine synthase